MKSLRTMTEREYGWPMLLKSDWEKKQCQIDNSKVNKFYEYLYKEPIKYYAADQPVYATDYTSKIQMRDINQHEMNAMLSPFAKIQSHEDFISTTQQDFIDPALVYKPEKYRKRYSYKIPRDKADYKKVKKSDLIVYGPAPLIQSCGKQQWITTYRADFKLR